MNYFKLAWRNIWRNKKRTFITAGSVFFALFLSIIMIGLQKGVFNHAIEVSVGDFFGYIQVHNKGYVNEKILNNSFEYSDELKNDILSVDNVKEVQPRIETFTLSAYGEKTKGIAVMGVLPEVEFSRPGHKQRLVEGEFPTTENGGLLISEKYAEYIGAGIGDSIAFIGQGYHGVSAVGLYHVVGIIKFPNPQLNAGLAYMNLEDAQELFNLESRLTSIVVQLENNEKYKETCEEIKDIVSDEYEVLAWDEEMPELQQMVESKAGSSQIILLILYIVVGFGIFGTALMMIAERKKEFAIMVAVGMKKIKLITLVVFELFYVIVLGIIASIVVSFPLMYYWHINPIPLTGEIAETYANFGFDPIIPVAWDLSYYIGQPIVVIVISIIAMLYPILTIRKMNVIKSLKK